jgi:hypothetical protein
MARMRRVSFILVLALFVLAGRHASAADEPIGVRKRMPKTVAALEKQLVDLGSRISRLLEAANLDPAQKKIEMYKKYTPKELKKTRGRVRAEDLVAFMVDPSRDFPTVREAAMTAIYEGGAFRGDPELSDSLKSGSRTKRAHFCDKQLLAYLKSPKVGGKPVDRFSRKLVNDLLKSFYPGAERTHPEIRIYNPVKDKTWKSAHGAWYRFLKKN